MRLRAAMANATITRADAFPFRLEATIDTMDWQGKPDVTGTIEEEWLSPKFSRQILVFGGKRRTVLMRDGVVSVTGDQYLGNFMQDLLLQNLLSPGPNQKQVTNSVSTVKQVTLGSVTLDCVLLTPTDATDRSKAYSDQATSYCISGSPPILRLVNTPLGFTITLNHIAQLGTHFVARDVTVGAGATPRGVLHVTSFKKASELQESDFVVAPGASPDMIAGADESLTGGKLKSKVSPTYPAEARIAHQTGHVVTTLLIDSNGVPISVEVLNAPSPSLAKAAQDAVRQWRFEPSLRGDKPVAFHMMVDVRFGPA